MVKIFYLRFMIFLYRRLLLRNHLMNVERKVYSTAVGRGLRCGYELGRGESAGELVIMGPPSANQIERDIEDIMRKVGF